MDGWVEKLKCNTRLASKPRLVTASYVSLIYPISSPAPKLQLVRGLLIVTGVQ
jgi:hypothetical protein